MRLHIDGAPCRTPACAQTHIPPAPVEPDCPRCKKGALVEMTGFADRYAKCAVYLVCESCSYEKYFGSDGNPLTLSRLPSTSPAGSSTAKPRWRPTGGGN